MNKKAMTFGLWAEVILFSMAFVLILGFVVASFNTSFSQSKDASFGLATNDTINTWNDLQDTMDTGVKEGEATNNNLGISVSTTWGILKAIYSAGISFVTGGWIRSTINMLNMGYAGNILATILQILYFASFAFILIKILFKVNP